MPKTIKKSIAALLTVCFLGTNVLYAQAENIFTVAPPSRFSRIHGPEFKQAAEIVNGIRESLRDLADLDRDGLRALGRRPFFEHTVFGKRPRGNLLFHEATGSALDARIRIGEGHYLIKAHVTRGSDYYCLISRGNGITYDVTVIPERVMSLALESGNVKFTHDSLDRDDRDHAGGYLEPKTPSHTAPRPSGEPIDDAAILERNQHMRVENEVFRRQVETTARDIFRRAKKHRSNLLFRNFGLRGLTDRLIRFTSTYEATQKNIFYFIISLGGTQLKAPTGKSARKHNAREYKRIVDNMADYLTGRENRFLVRVPVSIIVSLSKEPHIGRIVARTVLWMIRNVFARRFFIGEEVDKAVRTITALERKGFSLTVDNVGELSLCTNDSNKYVSGYLRLSENGVPALSIKLSNLTSHWNANAWERTKGPIKDQMKRVIEAASEIGAEVTIDMEDYKYKDLTIEIFLELLEETGYDKLSICIQCYLRDEALNDLARIVDRVRSRGLKKPLIRLVKGCNIVLDGVTAAAEGRPAPQYSYKAQADISFERCAEYMFENREFLRLAFATHNIQSMAVAVELAKAMDVKGSEFMLQFLHGMIPPEVVKAAQETEVGGEKVRVLFYGPFGPFIRGLGYLVRRLVEKTDANSFLQNEGYSKRVIDKAVRDPREVLRAILAGTGREEKAVAPTKRDPVLPRVREGLDAAERLAGYYLDTGAKGDEWIAEAFLGSRREVMDLTQWASESLMDMQGRTNELIAEPRGTVLFVAGDSAATDEDIAKRLAAPIATGNRVIAFLNNGAQIRRFARALSAAGIGEERVTLKAYRESAILDLIGGGSIDSVSYMAAPVEAPGEAGKARRRKAFIKSYEGLSRFIPGQEGYKPGGTSDRNFVFEITPDYTKRFLKTRVFSEFTHRAGFNPQSKGGIASKGLRGFKSVAQMELFREEHQEELMTEIARVEELYGSPDLVPLIINGTLHENLSNMMPVLSAAEPEHPMGWMSLAQPSDVHMAVNTARRLQKEWENAGAERRAEILLRFAELAEERRLELAALMMWESGKTAEEALADVYEGIDFARFYALDAIRSEKEEATRTGPGMRWEGWRTEANGVSAVISPWNFPFAIPSGQILGALAAGNTVVFKPAEESPLMGFEIAKLLKEAGLPDGVMNFLPGAGETAGDALVMHPDVDEILFTGSAEVGLKIKEKAAGVDRGDRPPKHIIAEMGGNNAIIVDNGTDVDQAIKVILASAFGFSSQKCSACNRVIALEGVYDQLLPRLQEAALAMIDIMDDPRRLGTFFGPLISDEARARMESFIQRAEDEGLRVLVEGVSDTTKIGFRIYRDVDPNSPLAQEEQFFPTLSLMKADTFEEAVDILNATPYALTAGVISQIPAHIEYARTHIKAGNLTINGKITGAMVGQQSFGGSGLSGFSDFYSKAGGMGHVWYHRRWVKTTDGTMAGAHAPSEPAAGKRAPTFARPEDADIRAVAARILENDIEVFMPRSQFPGHSLRKYKKGLLHLFGNRIRIYNDLTDITKMVNQRPEKAIVMTVDLTPGQIEALEAESAKCNLDLSDVRFMNFQHTDIDTLVERGVYENYLKDTLSKLLVARAITKKEAEDKSSLYYRMLAHLLEGHLQEDAIDAYIKEIVNTTMNIFNKLGNLVQRILSSIPIEAYDTEKIKPAVEVLWAA